MEDYFHHLILRRNAYETQPFLSVHKSNNCLSNVVDTLQSRCESLERQYLEQQQLLACNSQLNSGLSLSEGEIRLREKVSELQDELSKKILDEVKSSANSLELSKSVSLHKQEKLVQDRTISNLRTEVSRCEEVIAHLSSELEEMKSRARLAEKQFDGLKEAIRSLQIENEEKTKLNQQLLNNSVTEKENMAEQLNSMNSMVEKLQQEVNMLRSYTKMEKSWFGISRKFKVSSFDDHSNPGANPSDLKSGRQWGVVGAVLPSQPLHTIKAHKEDASCVRYDGTNLNLIATASSDATVRVWDTNSGQLQGVFSGGGSQPMLGVDLSGGIVCGCGADRTCRVWKYETKRLIHQLVGHSQKITCVRLFPGEKSVLTGSADRSIRIWDISRHIYTHTTTFRHSSTANCSDTSGEMPSSIVTGHLDGGIRFWDARTGDRSLDIPSLHTGGVTCVQWKPRSSHEILTNGRDSLLKIIDARTMKSVHTFQDPEFRTVTNYSLCSFSPDGAYAAAGSGENGDIFVWNTSGHLEKRLSGLHQHGSLGLAWGTGGSNGQQVATIDKSGVLILWA